MMNIPYDILNTTKIITHVYIDGTTKYECFANAWTDLIPSTEQLAQGRWRSIVRYRNFDTPQEISRRWKDDTNSKSFFGSSHLSAESLEVVESYNYQD